MSVPTWPSLGLLNLVLKSWSASHSAQIYRPPGPQPPDVRTPSLRTKSQAPTTSGLSLTMKVALSPERTAGPEDSSTSGVRSGGEERALPS